MKASVSGIGVKAAYVNSPSGRFQEEHVEVPRRLLFGVGWERLK